MSKRALAFAAGALAGYLVLAPGEAQVLQAVTRSAHGEGWGTGVLSAVFGGLLAAAAAEVYWRWPFGPKTEGPRAALARLEHILAESPAVIYVSDASSPFATVYVSENVRALTGYDPCEITGQPGMWAGLIHPEDFSAAMERLRLARQRGTLQHEYRLRRKDGRYVWVHDALKVVLDSEGRPAEVVGTRMDVTARRAAEEALVRSEEKFSRLFRSLNDAVFIYSAEGRILDANPRAEELFGYGHEDLPSLSLSDLHPPHAIAGARLALKAASREGAVKFETEFRTREGAVFPAEVSAAVVDIEGREAVQGIIRDITERREAERKIRTHIERLNALRAVDRAISSSFDLRVTLGVCVGEAVSILGVDAADVLLLTPAAMRFEYYVGRGFQADGMERTALGVEEGWAGAIAKAREPMMRSDLARAMENSSRARLLEAEGFKTYMGFPLVVQGAVRGVLEVFHRTPLSPEPDWLEFLESLAGQMAIAIDKSQMFEELQRSNAELVMAYDAAIEGWSRALDYRDKETEGHSQRVTEMTVRVAREMGMGEAELAHVRRGALLHDIGKLGVPDRVLFKPGRLDNEEWGLMKRHPQIAFDLLSPIAFLRPALDIPLCHHEKWDGTGYPRGLRGEQIPLAARIFAIVDVWDALNSDRPYRKAWPRDKISAHIGALSGTHFDPRVVEVFLRLKW
ncbi:MAG: hypothetical protein Kow0025_24500 [Thermodesulfovibrionales bacterium]